MISITRNKNPFKVGLGMQLYIYVNRIDITILNKRKSIVIPTKIAINV